MARSEWETVQDMMNGKFTGDAAGRSDTDYLKATNKARIDACIKEDLEDKLYDANEQLGVIYDIRYSGGGRYTVEYSARGFSRGKNDYQVRQSIVRAPAPIVRETKDSPAVQRYFDKIRNAPNNQAALQAIAKEADNDDGLSSAELKEVQAHIIHKVRTGRSNYDAKDPKQLSTKEIYAELKTHPQKSRETALMNELKRRAREELRDPENFGMYINQDAKVEKWTDAWDEFDRIRRRLEPDWPAIMKEVKKLYDRHRGDPNWDEGYRRFIGN